MNPRLNFLKQSPKAAGKLFELGKVVQSASLPAGLVDLINIRASQLNGCAHCLDIHVKEAKIRGEKELRLYHVTLWRESPLFSERERAALEWTEVVTRLPAEGISDETFARVRAQFSEQELSDLTFAIGNINLWNRLNIAFKTVPGSADELLGLTRAGLVA